MDAARIAVVGGSLGGLTAACLLRDDGHDVRVYERSSRELEQRGAGIGFLEATYRYLVERTELPLDEVSISTDWIRHLDRHGKVAHALEHRYLFSSWNAVYRQLLEHWDLDRYHLGHEIVSIEQRDEFAIAVCADGTRIEADLVVCADGVGSTLRGQFQPDASQGYAGYVAWRGMVPEADLPSEIAGQLTDAITYYVYANSHILVYPIPGIDGSVEPGDRLINFVWYRNYLEGAEFEDLMTDVDGHRRDLSLPPGSVAPHHDAEVRAHAAARLPPVIANVVEHTEDLFVQVVYDIEVDKMVFGNACLLGDAAFAVRPHAAAGTAKAAEDGWALARHLRASEGVPEALAAWEPEQLALGRQLLERTRRIGRRSQIDNTWTPGDPEFIFGLHAPGD